MDELLAHLGWVQRLARSLIRVQDDADDLAQETLRVTLAQPRGRVGTGTRLRGWLSGVARRLALDQMRASVSRRHHEARAAEHRVAPSALDVVQRSACQQRVVQAVMEMEPHARSDLGHGIEVTHVDGVDITSQSKEMRQLRLDDGRFTGDMIALPARCTFVRLDR